MKLKAKIAIALVAATTSVFGLGSGAIAGEGGAAGAAAFTIVDGDVTGVAVAAAIGKNDASSYARQENGINIAAALGSGGVIRMGNIGNETISMDGGDDQNLGTAQANNFQAATTLTIGTGNGDTLVNIAPAP